MMRSKIVWLLALLVGLGTGCRKAQREEAPKEEALKGDVLASFHFIGMDRLKADTNAARWTAMEAMPETRELEAQTLAKLAKVPHEFLRNRLAVLDNNYTNLIQPLLEDLVRAESFAEMRAEPNQTPEFVLAVRLKADRAQVWKTNLATVLSSWTTIKVSEFRDPNSEGWELRKHHRPNLIRFERAGEWVVLGWGQEKLPLLAEFVDQIRRTGRPRVPASEGWLEAAVDWPRLQPRLERQLAVPLPVHLPEMYLTLTNKDDDLRTMVDLVFPQPIAWSPEPWRIPTDTIRDPLISFTAGQGIALLLNQWPAFQDLGIEPVPNQFFVWALANIPLQTFLAVPASDTTNLLGKLGPKLEAQFQTRLQEHAVGTVQWVTNTSSVVWQGLPFIVPFIQPLVETNGEFLFVGMFPNTPEAKPPPPELFAQIEGRTNLVYYDWEITQSRLDQWWNLSQLFRLLGQKRQLGTNEAAANWLNAIAPKLGNTVTEVTVTAPNQLTVLRKSPIGLTAFELVALANWLEWSQFPLGGHGLPKRAEAGPAVSSVTSSNAAPGR